MWGGAGQRAGAAPQHVTEMHGTRPTPHTCGAPALGRSGPRASRTGPRASDKDLAVGMTCWAKLAAQHKLANCLETLSKRCTDLSLAHPRSPVYFLCHPGQVFLPCGPGEPGGWTPLLQTVIRTAPGCVSHQRTQHWPGAQVSSAVPATSWLGTLGKSVRRPGPPFLQS